MKYIRTGGLILAALMLLPHAMAVVESGFGTSSGSSNINYGLGH